MIWHVAKPFLFHARSTSCAYTAIQAIFPILSARLQVHVPEEDREACERDLPPGLIEAREALGKETFGEEFTTDGKYVLVMQWMDGKCIIRMYELYVFAMPWMIRL